MGAGAVAAALLAAVLIPTLTRGHRSDSTNLDSAASAPTATEAERKALAPQADASTGAAAGAVAAPAPPVDAGDLGPLGPLDQAVVQRKVNDALRRPPPATSRPARAASCDQAVRSAQPGLGALRLTGRATVQGRTAEVLAYEDASTGGRLRVFAVSPADCGQILLYATFSEP